MSDVSSIHWKGGIHCNLIFILIIYIVVPTEVVEALSHLVAALHHAATFLREVTILSISPRKVLVHKTIWPPRWILVSLSVVRS